MTKQTWLNRLILFLLVGDFVWLILEFSPSLRESVRLLLVRCYRLANFTTWGPMQWSKMFGILLLAFFVKWAWETVAESMTIVSKERARATSGRSAAQSRRKSDAGDNRLDPSMKALLDQRRKRR